MNYDLLPEHLRGGVQRYIEHGVIPGSFLVAVICNALREAVGYADDESLAALSNIVRWFTWNAPSECWGSGDKMAKWAAEKSCNPTA